MGQPLSELPFRSEAGHDQGKAPARNSQGSSPPREVSLPNAEAGCPEIERILSKHSWALLLFAGLPHPGPLHSTSSYYCSPTITQIEMQPSSSWPSQHTASRLLLSTPKHHWQHFNRYFPKAILPCSADPFHFLLHRTGFPQSLRVCFLSLQLPQGTDCTDVPRGCL